MNITNIININDCNKGNIKNVAREDYIIKHYKLTSIRNREQVWS